MRWAEKEHPSRSEVVRAELPRVKVSKIRMVRGARKRLKTSGTKQWSSFHGNADDVIRGSIPLRHTWTLLTYLDFTKWKECFR